MAILVFAWNAWEKWQYAVPGGLGVDRLSVGHVAMDLPGAYISWGGPFVGRRQLRTREEDMAEYRGKNAHELVVPLCTLDEQAILDWWRQFTANHETYFFFAYNCARVVAEALHAGSNKRPGARMPHHMIWTPRDAYLYALSLS